MTPPDYTTRGVGGVQAPGPQIGPQAPALDLALCEWRLTLDAMVGMPAWDYADMANRHRALIKAQRLEDVHLDRY